MSRFWYGYASRSASTSASTSGSGSVSQSYGSEDQSVTDPDVTDPHPDPYQNVTDPEHCQKLGTTVQYGTYFFPAEKQYNNRLSTNEAENVARTFIVP
jgi:hypothetical protein